MHGEVYYSIIIPHKNIPELLQRCLDSIPRRPDVQIIIVDDNSDPGKVDFEKFPGLNDPFIQVVFTKEGRGAGYAKNTALKSVKGRWLMIADADDYYADGFLDYMDKYRDSDYDLVYFGIYKINKYKKRGANIDYRYDKLMRDAVHYQKYDPYKYAEYNAWSKLIKVSLVKNNNITFDETRACTDRMFALKTASSAQNIHFDEHKIYNYEFRPGSITTTKTPETNFDRLGVYVRTNNLLDKISKKKYKANLIPPLVKLINCKDMTYFFRGLKLIKENKINIFAELFKFCIHYFYKRAIEWILRKGYENKK